MADERGVAGTAVAPGDGATCDGAFPPYSVLMSAYARDDAA